MKGEVFNLINYPLSIIHYPLSIIHYPLSIDNWHWSEQLGLYLGVEQEVLRYWTAEGNLVPTPTEAAQEAELRAQKLAEQLRSLGIEEQ